MKLSEELQVLIKSRYPIINVETMDETYCLDEIITSITSIGYQYFTWSITEGLRSEGVNSSYYGSESPSGMLNMLIHLLKKRVLTNYSVFILKDFNKYLEDSSVLRIFRDLINELYSLKDTIILLSPNYDLPKEIKTYSANILGGYPTEKEIHVILTNMIQEATRLNKTFQLKLDKNQLKSIVVILKGLSISQLKNFINHIINDNILQQKDIENLRNLKKKVFDTEGFLEYSITENIENIAGFNNLKKWLRSRKNIILNYSEIENLPIPKGVMLTGIQGCGKSLAIKAIAKELEMPLYRFDISKLYSSYIGETEKNLRKTLDIIEKLSPLCLWIDEIEKGFSVSDGKVDGGVSQRILGTFLTWMQERKEMCFIAVTANQIEKLPPEFLRKGRFDEIFFVDLPDDNTRRELIKIHIEKRKIPVENIDIDKLINYTVGFSGAEIEQAIVSALYNAESLDPKNVNFQMIVDEITSTKPLSIVRAEDITKIRNWAKEKTITA